MQLPIVYIFFLLITGIIAGVSSGLLGIGGCFIMVPVQFWILQEIGIDTTIAIRVAFGTGLFIVLPTVMSSTWGHHQKKVILWKPAILIGLIGLIGGFIGGCMATHLPGKLLRITFGIFIIVVAVRMFIQKSDTIKETKIIDNNLTYLLFGFLIGLISGILGIGGGTLMVPIMTIILKFNMHQAVGTSSAAMILISIGGILAYILNGLTIPNRPYYSIGYINLLQWALLASTSVPCAQLGVKIAHKLPAEYLKYVFIIVMGYIGLKMIGLLG